MIVTTVSVRIHEKRSHPFAHGHYDTEVVYTAEVEPDELVGDVEETLIERGQLAVKAECDLWEEGVHKNSQESYYYEWKKVKVLLRNLVDSFPEGPCSPIDDGEAYLSAEAYLGDMDEIPF